MTKGEGNTHMGARAYVKLAVPEHLYLRALTAIGSLEANGDPDNMADRNAMLTGATALLEQQRDETVAENARLRAEIERLSAALIDTERAEERSNAELTRLRARVDVAAALGIGVEPEQASVQASEQARPEPEEAPVTPAPGPADEPLVTLREIDLVALRNEAIAKGLTQGAMAKAMGVTQTAISRMFLGRTPNHDLAVRLAAWVAKQPAAPKALSVPRDVDAAKMRGAAGNKASIDKVKEPVEKWIAERLADAGPDDRVLNPELRDAYEAWAKETGALVGASEMRGFGMILTSRYKKQQLRQALPDGTKPMAYYGVRFATAAERIERRTAAERDARQQQTDAVKAMIKASRTKRDAEPEPEPVTPYVAATKAPAKREPILAVRNHEERSGNDFAGVRIIKADGKVTYVDASVEVDAEADAAPVPPEKADAQSFDLWTDYKNGYDKNFTYLPDVLALEGLNQDEIETCVRKPQHVEIRPESATKGYPVLGFQRGDTRVIMGFQQRTKPAVIAAYWTQLMGHDYHRVNHTGSGGSRREAGLPSTVKASVVALRRRGLTVPDAWESATQPIEVSYDGKVLGKMKVHLANKQQVQGDYQRLLRQAHAIDRRKEAVGA